MAKKSPELVEFEARYAAERAELMKKLSANKLQRLKVRILKIQDTEEFADITGDLDITAALEAQAGSMTPAEQVEYMLQAIEKTGNEDLLGNLENCVEMVEDIIKENAGEPEDEEEGEEAEEEPSDDDAPAW